MSITSVKSYNEYFEQAYLIFSLKRFLFNIKEQEKSPRKIHAIDTGLRNTIGFRFLENYGERCICKPQTRENRDSDLFPVFPHFSLLKFNL